MLRRNAQQLTINFNPVELTDEERDRLRRAFKAIEIAEEMEEFEQLPGETAEEFAAARERHRQMLETFGPSFQPRPPMDSEAWLLMHGQLPKSRAEPPRGQLGLPFD